MLSAGPDTRRFSSSQNIRSREGAPIAATQTKAVITNNTLGGLKIQTAHARPGDYRLSIEHGNAPTEAVQLSNRSARTRRRDVEHLLGLGGVEGLSGSGGVGRDSAVPPIVQGVPAAPESREL